MLLMRGVSFVLALLLVATVVVVAVPEDASATGGCRPWITWEPYHEPATGLYFEKYPHYRGMVC